MKIYPLLTSLLCAAACLGNEYYVSTAGSDSNDGSIGSPFLTLGKARDVIRAGTPAAGHTVYVRAGTHWMPEGFALTSADSGGASTPVTYRNYPGENALLRAGRPITNWVTHSGDILKADVTTQSLSGIYFRDLFWGEQRQILARKPDYNPSAAIPDGNWFYTASGSSTTAFVGTAGDLEAWPDAVGAEVMMFTTGSWDNSLRTISVLSGNNVTLSNAVHYSIQPGWRYFVRNVFSELDAHNEWYLTNSGTVYWYPPVDYISTDVVWVPTADYVISIGSGSSNIVVRGLRIQGSVKNGIYLNTTTSCAVYGNEITLCGSYPREGWLFRLDDSSGVLVSSGTTNRVVGNDISQCGFAGVSVSGGGTKTPMARAGNLVENNLITDIGVHSVWGGAVLVSGYGQYVVGNTLTNLPRAGVFSSGSAFLTVKSNLISDFIKETDDMGGVYFWSSGYDGSGDNEWLESRGTDVSYNRIVGGIGVGDLGSAVYGDSITHGVDVHHNILSHTSGALLHSNFGRDWRVWNNVLFAGPRYDAYTTMLVRANGVAADYTYWTSTTNDAASNYDAVAGDSAWTGLHGWGVRPDIAWPNDQTVGGWIIGTNVLDGGALNYGGIWQSWTVSSNTIAGNQWYGGSPVPAWSRNYGAYDAGETRVFATYQTEWGAATDTWASSGFHTNTLALTTTPTGWENIGTVFGIYDSDLRYSAAAITSPEETGPSPARPSTLVRGKLYRWKSR